MDIVVCTKPEILKQRKSTKGHHIYYWTLKKCPTNFKVGDKIFLVTNGYIKGSFTSIEYNPHQEETIVFDADSWMVFNAPWGKSKPFGGFRYRWWGLKRKREVKR